MRRLLFLLAGLTGSALAASSADSPSRVAAPILDSSSSADAAMVDRIFGAALTRGQAYEDLRALTSDHPGRLGGSESLEGAVVWAERVFAGLKLDQVYKQEVTVPHWERGERESVQLLSTVGAPVTLSALALGGSGPSPREGLTAEVVEVQSLDELAQLGRERLAGKIVFFNRPLKSDVHLPGKAYMGAGDQRTRGPGAAARFGAVAALTRSLTHALDDVPHTGSTTYPPNTEKIPAAALSTLAADQLSAALRADPRTRVEIKIHSRSLPDALSHNVIGEIRGSEFPEEIILVGGHIDSWDVGPGAHDDGAGVVQAIEVLRLFQTLGIKPRHTLRCVLFTSEENSLNGATVYASAAKTSGQRHLFAVESDSGGFAPNGFEFGSTQGEAHLRAARWRPLFETWGLWHFRKGGAGADVAPLLLQGVTVAQINPDSQRYLDYHHTAIDSLDKVNPRELQLGAGALASLIWLVDTYGL
jgi:carboxypeptidase Q